MNVKKTTINAIRVLSAEAIEKAKSGHPGLPLGCAPIAYTLFQNFLKFNPRNANWDDRDRFILSAGHGSAMYYSLLHLYGFGLEKEDLMNFRQFGSKTLGELGMTGDAMAEALSASYQKAGQQIAAATGLPVDISQVGSAFSAMNRLPESDL